MINMTNRELFISALRSRVGYPYRYGGQGDSDFDCSGFVLWGLAQAGILLPDMSSNMMCKVWRKYATKNPIDGCIVFYNNPATHVMVVNHVWGKIGKDFVYTLIGSRGGASQTKTMPQAWADGAMTDVVKGDYMKNSQTTMVNIFDSTGKFMG